MLRFQDFGFERVPVVRYSTRGTQFVSMEPVGMPKLNPNTLDMVFYLYPTVEDAKAGKNVGGTGFFVARYSDVHHPRVSHLYAVTNWHVACQSGCSVIRLNTKDGGVDIIDYGPEDWGFLPQYDIAVVGIPYNHDAHQVCFIGVENFLTKDMVKEHGIGCGEDVFMVGRFVDHDGGHVNRPALRFGNISVMPTPIKQPNGKVADAYCLDLHSRSGYSGSPVFVYRTPGYDLTDIPKEGAPKQVLVKTVNLLCFLGIHFAQFPEEWPIVTGKKPAAENNPLLITDGAYVKGLSGMTCVLPAWAIEEVLDMPKFQQQRKNADVFFTEKYAAEGKAVPQAEVKSSDSQNPSHKEDFTALLGAAARKQQ